MLLSILASKKTYAFRTGLIALAVALNLLFPPLVKAAPAKEPIRVVYGFDREFPPFSFEDAGGKPVGFEVELVQAIFDGKVNLTLRPLQWDMVPLELSGGTITLTSGMVRTEQRSKTYGFSANPTFLLPIYLFTKTYNRFPNATFLRGQMVSVEQGSYQHRLLENFSGINIKPFKDKIPAIRALYNDEVNAYCGPLQTAYYYMRKLNYTGITTLGTPLGLVEMRIAVNRDRGDVLKMVNEGFAKVVQSGEYNRIYRKWFVKEPNQEEQDQMIKAAKAAVLTAYAPYSKQGKGAAILTATGKIYTGCTVENADARLNVSAVTAAATQTVGNGELEIRAVVQVDGNGAIIQPSMDDCQFLYEFGRGIVALVEPQKGQRTMPMMGELLLNPVVGKTPVLNIE